MKDTKGVGERSEAIILAHLLRKGLVVLLPFGNNQPYDLVVDEGGSFLRVQCKTGRIVNGCVVFEASRRSTINGKRRSYAGLADVLIVYCPDNDLIYRMAVTATVVGPQTLRIDPPKRCGLQAKIKWAKDYVF